MISLCRGKKEVERAIKLENKKPLLVAPSTTQIARLSTQLTNFAGLMTYFSVARDIQLTEHLKTKTKRIHNSLHILRQTVKPFRTELFH